MAKRDEPHRMKINWEAVKINRDRFANERLCALAEQLEQLDRALAESGPMQAAALLAHVEIAFADLRGMVAALDAVRGGADKASTIRAEQAAKALAAPMPAETADAAVTI